MIFNAKIINKIQKAEKISKKIEDYGKSI